VHQIKGIKTEESCFEGQRLKQIRIKFQSTSKSLRKYFLFEKIEEAPAYAVLTTFLNLFSIWVSFCSFRLSTFIPYGIKTDLHTTDKGRPPVPRCWLKKIMLITHIAGNNLFLPNFSLPYN